MSEKNPFGRGRMRRLFGLDRSAPPPRQTRSGEPLNPWTLPNLVGYVRLAAIPVFLVLAYRTDDGTSFLAAMVFWAIAAGDYVDGFLARVTGQYSRLGTLLDPLVDRGLVICGVIVAWHFELLPRWALAVLAARELFMLLVTQAGLRRGIDLNVNMAGRLAVWPTMFSIFLAMVSVTWVAELLLYIGLAMTLWATALYVRDGVRALRRERS
jgi:cardiolipin synthase